MAMSMAKLTGHRIISASHKWMTTQDAPRCDESAAQHSKSFHGLQRVLGAGRHIAARRWKQRGYPALVSPEHPQCQPLHFYFSAIFLAITSKARLTSSSRIGNSTFKTDFFGLI